MKKYPRSYWLVLIFLPLLLSGFTAATTPYENASLRIYEEQIRQQSRGLDDWATILNEAYQLAGLKDTASVRSYSENGYVQGMASDGSNCIVIFAAHSPTSVYYEYIYREMKAQLTDTMFHEFSAKEGMANDINGELISQELIFTVDDYRIIAGFSCTPPYSKSWDDVYRNAEILYSVINGRTTNSNPTPEGKDLCSGVKCPANSCKSDGMTLVHDCACNQENGQCECLETYCLGGCDPASNTCKQDLCSNVTCPDKCENNSSFTGGTCNPASGVCEYRQVTDCDTGVCDPNTFLCVTPHDLAITDVLIVQVIEGATLVGYKPTAVAVFLHWPDPNVDAEIEVTLSINGNPIQTIKKVQKATYTIKDTFFNRDKVIFHLPRYSVPNGNHQFTIEARLLNDQFVDSDLTNNTESLSKSFVLTKSLTLLYAHQQNVSLSQVHSFHNRARGFLMEVFPLHNVNMAPVVYPIDQNEFTFSKILIMEEFRNLYNATPGQYARFIVGLYPDGFYGTGVYGFSYSWARRSVMVGDGSVITNAHEALAHEMGHEFFGEGYWDNIFIETLGEPLPDESFTYDSRLRMLRRVKDFNGGLIDLMGRAGGVENLWISAETWNYLVDQYRIGSLNTLYNQNKLAKLFNESARAEGFLISGTIDKSDQVNIRNMYHFDDIEIEPVSESDYWINVVGNDNSSVGLFPVAVEFEEDSAEGYFVVNFPVDQNEIQALQILHHDSVIWTSQASSIAPQITIDPPISSQPLKGINTLSWDASDEDSPDLTFSILYSADGGEIWTPLATGLKNPSLEVDFDQLPSGSDCLLRVIASDGWNTVTAETKQSFAVFDDPAELVIESPLEGSVFSTGDEIDLIAYVSDFDSPWLDGEKIQWDSSLDGDLGFGSYMVLTNLSPGKHEITVHATTLDTGDLKKTVMITVGESKTDRNQSIIRSGIVVEILLVLLIAMIVLVVVFKRKNKRVMFILSIITLIGTSICFLLSLINFAGSILEPVSTSSETENAENPRSIIPLLTITPSSQLDPTTEVIIEPEKNYETQNSNGIVNNYQGITLQSPVGSGFMNETTESTIGPDSFFGMPAHIHITIQDYPVLNSVFDAEIRVFDLEEYMNADPEAADIIRDLQQLLIEKPTVLPQNVPFLPSQPCGLAGNSKIAYIDIASGGGLRYLTQCVQNTWPVNNNLLFYTFQGITSDQRYYVSAIFPVTHESLQPYDNFEPEDDFLDTALQLVADQFADLDLLEDNTFAPSITDLDGILESIEILN